MASPQEEMTEMTRALLVGVAILLVGAHYTGNMKSLISAFDIGLDSRYLLYFAALPFTCLAAFMLLRD
jgi:hypothetical protein